VAPPSTAGIDDVVSQLDVAVAGARDRGDPAGFFAALYGQTTRAVRAQVLAGGFDDGPRMVDFVSRFAGRYMAALAAGQAGQPMCRSWQAAFDLAARRGHDTLILQHLLLGMNAHINLDLAVAAADLCPGDAISGLQGDFQRINAVLGALLGPVRTCLDRFSPLLDVLDRVGGHDDDQILNFSIRVAREEAWTAAVTLATGGSERREELVDSLDRRVAVLARLVATPGGLLQRAVDLVAASESDDVVAVIDALGQVVPSPE
jgi:Family of unknown function (DUF5995)